MDREPSLVWQYFTEKKEGSGDCDLCESRIASKNGQTTSMWRHLKNLHRPQFKILRPLVVACLLYGSYEASGSTTTERLDLNSHHNALLHPVKGPKGNEQNGNAAEPAAPFSNITIYNNSSAKRPPENAKKVQLMGGQHTISFSSTSSSTPSSNKNDQQQLPKWLEELLKNNTANNISVEMGGDGGGHNGGNGFLLPLDDHEADDDWDYVFDDERIEQLEQELGKTKEELGNTQQELGNKDQELEAAKAHAQRIIDFCQQNPGKALPEQLKVLPAVATTDPNVVQVEPTEPPSPLDNLLNDNPFMGSNSAPSSVSGDGHNDNLSLGSGQQLQGTVSSADVVDHQVAGDSSTFWHCSRCNTENTGESCEVCLKAQTDV